jgi:hypothetical protein
LKNYRTTFKMHLNELVFCNVWEIVVFILAVATCQSYIRNIQLKCNLMNLKDYLCFMKATISLIAALWPLIVF